MRRKELLVKLRDQHSLNQREMAERLKVKHSTYAAWEWDNTRRIPWRFAQKIAQMFKISPEALSPETPQKRGNNININNQKIDNKNIQGGDVYQQRISELSGELEEFRRKYYRSEGQLDALKERIRQLEDELRRRSKIKGRVGGVKTQ